LLAAHLLYITVIRERATVVVGLHPVVQMKLIPVRTGQFYPQFVCLGARRGLATTKSAAYRRQIDRKTKEVSAHPDLG
jgi:hypothetical protein